MVRSVVVMLMVLGSIGACPDSARASSVTIVSRAAIPLKIVPVHIPLAVIPVTSSPVIERVHAQPSPHVHATVMASSPVQSGARRATTRRHIERAIEEHRKAAPSISTPPAPPNSKISPASAPPPPHALSNTARRTAPSRRSKTS